MLHGGSFIDAKGAQTDLFAWIESAKEHPSTTLLIRIQKPVSIRSFCSLKNSQLRPKTSGLSGTRVGGAVNGKLASKTHEDQGRVISFEEKNEVSLFRLV
jgi:hypothetical protein